MRIQLQGDDGRARDSGRSPFASLRGVMLAHAKAALSELV
jgi:hypothetical protein